MSTMNNSLPDSLKSFVDEQVAQRGYGTSSEYERELIRKDADLLHLRGLLLKGAASTPAAPIDTRYFSTLRARLDTNCTGSAIRLHNAMVQGRRPVRCNADWLELPQARS